MHHNDDHAPTPDQRLRMVARTFAAGVLRLRARIALPGTAVELPTARILSETAANPLDVSAQTRLSVHPG
jgi:hypothetical protein